jgi:ERCC4-type nuclease
MIIVDNREKKPYTDTNYWIENSVEFEFGTLNVGDYSNGSVVIERKGKDFPSIVTKRFERELQRGKVDYLIIEMTVPQMSAYLKRYSKMSIKFIMSKLKYIHKEYGVQIIFADGKEAAAEIALVLLKE